MTGLFVGLITNYLYDKTKSPDLKLVDIEILLKKQETKLQELESLLVKEKNPKLQAVANQRCELHKHTVVRIRDSDPELEEMVEDVLRQLEQRGQKPLSDEIDPNGR